MVRLDARAGGGIRDTGRELPVLGGQPVRARVRAEVLVEAAVLLHDHDYVLDLVDPACGRRHGGWGGRCWVGARGGREGCHRERQDPNVQSHVAIETVWPGSWHYGNVISSLAIAAEALGIVATCAFVS